MVTETGIIKNNNIMKDYKHLKNKLRNRAIELQNTILSECSSYMELSDLQDRIYLSAKRYGLIREFREKGIL